MTSERKIAANRINGRKGRGPRTAAGKLKASRNALRHGLSTISYLNPAVAGEIKRMAQAICPGDAGPLVFEQALIIAEADLVLRCVAIERVAAIERLRDVTATPIVDGDTRLARAKARSEQSERAWDELQRLDIGDDNDRLWPTEEQEERLQAIPWDRPPLSERDEFNAMEAAMPDLERLARYERRAWSRQKRAIRMYLYIKATTGDVVSDYSQCD